MQKCVLITNDTRATLQMRGWFKLFANQPYLETFNSVERFEAKYKEPLKQKDLLIDNSGSNGFGEEPDERSRLQELEAEAETTPLTLFIVDLDAIPSKPLDWIVKKREELLQLGHFKEDKPLKVLLLGYDDPNVRPDRFRHESVDDMVIKPLDQQLFLQKVELLLADKPDSPPSFLFRAKAEGTVEMGKDATIDEISDFAISIRNPGPLSDGVFAQVHCRIFGEGLSSSQILGRSYVSVRHPNFENLWLVRFALFGVTSGQLAELRKFIRSKQIPSRTRFATPARRTTRQKDLPPRHRIAVIDLNRDILDQAVSTIEENFDRTAVTIFPSYTRLLGGLAKLSGQAEATASSAVIIDEDSEPTAEGGIPFGRVTISVTEKEFNLMSFDPNPPATDNFLARPIKDWLERPRAWFDAIPKNDIEDFNEFLSYTTHGGKGVTGVRFVNNSGEFVYAEIKGSHVLSKEPDIPNHLRLDLKQVDRSTWAELNRLTSKGVTPDSFRFDAVIIDGGLIRGDIATWLEGFHQALVRAGVHAATDPLPRIIVIADEDARIEPALFAHRGVADFLYKPLDRKLVTDKLSAALPQLTRMVHLEASPFVSSEVTAQVCKGVELEELSEFGLTIRHPTPFKARVFMRFFSPLFGESAEGVLARCSASIPVPNVNAKPGTNDVSYNCHFVFFGCSDELHKRIRNWIREDYVSKKESTV